MLFTCSKRNTLTAVGLACHPLVLRPSGAACGVRPAACSEVRAARALPAVPRKGAASSGTQRGSRAAARLTPTACRNAVGGCTSRYMAPVQSHRLKDRGTGAGQGDGGGRTGSWRGQDGGMERAGQGDGGGRTGGTGGRMPLLACTAAARGSALRPHAPPCARQCIHVHPHAPEPKQRDSTWPTAHRTSPGRHPQRLAVGSLRRFGALPHRRRGCCHPRLPPLCQPPQGCQLCGQLLRRQRPPSWHIIWQGRDVRAPRSWRRPAAAPPPAAAPAAAARRAAAAAADAPLATRGSQRRHCCCRARRSVGPSRSAAASAVIRHRSGTATSGWSSASAATSFGCHHTPVSSSEAKEGLGLRDGCSCGAAQQHP